MMRVHPFCIISGAILVGVLLIGCEQSQGPMNNTPVPTATGGPVTLHVGAASYRTSDTISVTLSNQGTEKIYFLDHQTNCTVILLQQLVNGSWQTVNECGLGGLSSWLSLNAGQALTTKLTPPPNTNWSTGLYRATLRYRIGQAFNSQTTIYSEGFTIM